MNQIKKSIIIIQPGPIHLFWTTGIFYFWMLKEKFDFVFIVSSNYLNSTRFQKLVKLSSIVHVEYLDNSNIIWRYKKYLNQYIYILNKFAPSYLLLNNTSYPENLYLIHLTKKKFPKSKIFHYQNGRMSLMWKNDFLIRRSIQIENIFHKIPFLSYFPKSTTLLIDLYNLLLYFFHLKIIPFLLIFRIFTPPVNVFNGAINVDAAKLLYSDAICNVISYLEIEAEVYREQGINNVILIKHPMSNCAYEVFDFIYGNFALCNYISIFPSHGFTSTLIKNGWSEKKIIDHISRNWISAVDMLLRNFPRHEIKFKLHPGSHNDQIWVKIIEKLEYNLGSKLEIINSKFSAEFLVAKSSVIAGDVSSVLWWAALYGKKCVISFDIFGYLGGNEMSFYEPAIQYVNDLSKNILHNSINRSCHHPELTELFY